MKSLTQILVAVSHASQLTISDIVSKSQKHTTVHARYAYMLIASEYYNNYDIPKITKFINKNRTLFYHAKKCKDFKEIKAILTIAKKLLNEK